MNASTAVRIAITIFTLLLLATVTLGWMWTAAHQPQPARMASHIVLAMAGAAGVFAIVRIWTARTK